MRKNKKNQLSYAFQNELTEMVKGANKESNTSFDEHLRYNTLQTTQNVSENSVLKHLKASKHPLKYQYPLDLTVEIKKYEQLANKEKWSKI